ncbi:Os01g0105400, partial [Oryza sativa Japonica Group]
QEEFTQFSVQQGPLLRVLLPPIIFNAGSDKRSGHIPYRDSKLTRILQLSLGGNARASIICTMSPAQTHVEQSRNTYSILCNLCQGGYK